MPHRKSTCIYRRILRLVPRIFRTDPWQSMLCVAALGVGLATTLAMFYPSTTSVVDKSLGWLALRGLWSACFVVGSLAQLAALQRPRDGLLERLGISLAGMGWAVYGLSLFAAGRPAGYALGVLLIVIALGHLVVVLSAEVARRLTNRTLNGG